MTGRSRAGTWPGRVKVAGHARPVGLLGVAVLEQGPTFASRRTASARRLPVKPSSRTGVVEAQQAREVDVVEEVRVLVSPPSLTSTRPPHRKKRPRFYSARTSCAGMETMWVNVVDAAVTHDDASGLYANHCSGYSVHLRALASDCHECTGH